MKRVFSFVLALIFFSLSFIHSFAFEMLDISAKAAVVMCAESREVVFSENMNERLSMASTTKIMTAVLALEYGASDEMLVVTDEMIAVEGTSMGLLGGDSVSLLTLVKGLLLESGNDAANAIAYIIGGDIPTFVKMMNDKAKEIGMNSTSFQTPSGLDGENHYSTAYDMALLACYAIQNPLFREICSSEELVVYYGNSPYRRVLTNHNKLLSMYDGVFGIKTGFTKKSGRCLVSAVTKDNKTLVAVTLNAPDDWNDHIKMYDYSFDKVTSVELYTDLSKQAVNVVGGAVDNIKIIQDRKYYYTTTDSNFSPSVEIYLKKFEYAPVNKGDVLGCVRYFNGDNVLIAEASVCSDVNIEYMSNSNNTQKKLFDKLKDYFR